MILSAASDAVPIAIAATGITALFAFVTVAMKQWGSQQGGWQVLVAAAEARATACDKRVTAVEKELERETKKRIAAEQQVSIETGRADMLGLRLDEQRTLVVELRAQIVALTGER